MLRLAVLAVVVSCAVAQVLPGANTNDEWNEQNKNDLHLYKECDDLSKFQPEMMGWWLGRTQINNKSYLKEYDIHNILKDGSGIVNSRSDKDHDKIARETPSKMWCKTYENGMDKAVKVQYGPTKYGQLICINLEVSPSRPDHMLVAVNQALFTDARIPMKYPVALDCLNYPYASKYNSYTIWADQLYFPSNSMWERTTAPKEGSDWSPDEKRSGAALRTLLKLLADSKA